MDRWDDVRLFLSVAGCRTTRLAARTLGVDQSTVSRRLTRLEADLGAQLFVRSSGGLSLTEAGQDLLAGAEQIAQAFTELDRRVLGRDVRLSGRIRFSVPDMMITPVASVVSAFCHQYPEVTVELVIENGYVDLTHRAADVALRLGTSMPEHLVGRRLMDAPAAIYGSRAYFDAHEPTVDVEDLERLDWIRWDEPWRNIPPERWMDAHVPGARILSRVNTNLAMVELTASGGGVGFQLCCTADLDDRLVRWGAPFDFGLSFWVLTHEDLRDTARIRAFIRFLAAALSTTG